MLTDLIASLPDLIQLCVGIIGMQLGIDLMRGACRNYRADRRRLLESRPGSPPGGSRRNVS